MVLVRYADSGIATLDDFIEWKYSVEVDDFITLCGRIDDGRLDMRSDPLGVFFELLRMTENESVGELVLHLSEGELRRDSKGGFYCPVLDEIRSLGILDKYGFSVTSPGLFMHNTSAEDLSDMVESWYESQPEKKFWNPLYAVPDALPEEAARFCRKNQPYDVLSVLNINRGGSGLIYPMTGWTLAECVRICYEK